MSKLVDGWHTNSMMWQFGRRWFWLIDGRNVPTRENMSTSESNNRKAVYYPPRHKYLWPSALLAAALALGGLILGLWRHEIVSQTPGGTPTCVSEIISQTLGGTPTRVSEIASQTLAVTPTSAHYLPLILQPPPAWARTYYVDSSLGSDRNSCTLAQNPSTPKGTVSGVMSCDPGPGEIVRFRGVFTETIFPTRSGTVLYDVQDIAQVNGSVVTFTQAITDIYPPTDYVTIYGSRKGNSGAFAIVSVSGNRVTVDTSDLPAGQFISEGASDPGALQAAVLRPVHFTAWDKNDPPVWNGPYQVYHAINNRVIMVSHLKSISGLGNGTYEGENPRYQVWPAFEIDGNNWGNSDFQIFDHLEVTDAECAIAIEFMDFHTKYNIIQFNNLHDIGWAGNTHADSVIYWGNAYHPERDHDYAQIMYNIIGPHREDPDAPYPMKGPGIEVKHSAENTTIFGNEIVGIDCDSCDNAPIKTSAPNTFIANNYMHEIDPPTKPGCGIAVTNDMTPLNPTLGGYGTIVANNIIADVRRVGIRVLDTSNVQILNNTIYNIFPEPNCDAACMEENMGIYIWNYQGPTENIVIKNNIVLSTHIGIGRYIWSNDYPVSIDSDYNIVFDAVYPFRGTIITNTHDLAMDPGLVDPENYSFALMPTSPARDSGTDLTSVFNIDNHDAADPRLPAITAPIIRTGVWDRGAYEYEEIQTPAPAPISDRSY